MITSLETGASSSEHDVRPDWTLASLPEKLTRFTYFRGRVALSAILRALGVARQDEVLLQAFTCVAVPEGIMSVGAKPVYVDVADGTLNMDPADLANKITDRTRALIIQHSYGMPADVVELIRIARERGIAVIEDCAHTIASRVGGRLVGSFGDAAFYSYEAAKPVFAGIGGSAIINDPSLEKRIAAAHSSLEEPPVFTQLETAALVEAYRIAYRPSTYWAVRSLFRSLSAAGLIRGNYNKVGLDLKPATDFERRMGRLQSGLLAKELKKLEDQTSQRTRVAGQYRSLIHSNHVRHFPIATDVEPVFGRYPLFAYDKREIVERARDARVEIAVFYDTPVQPLSGDGLRDVSYEPGSCSRAETLAKHVVSLPTGTHATQKQIDRTVAFLNSAT
jgi:dTDP-4-amino-4,6-dideoxygalactose transaminase